MTKQKIRAIGAICLTVVWVALTVFCWFGPRQELSITERRPLAQFPEISGKTLLNGKFMPKFESFTLDQFPMRDQFRQLKAWFHYNVLGQTDNNGIIMSDGYAAKLEYPMNETSMKYAAAKFNWLYENYFRKSGSTVFTAVVPDKNFYLAQKNDGLAMDYDKMFSILQEGMPYSTFVDLTNTLALEDYYYTDTHWRQEKIVDTAQKLCESMGVAAPELDDYTVTQATDSFYGVYYGQAALPMDAESLYILENDLLKDCVVYNHETQKNESIYNMEKLQGNDAYDVFLSGAVPLLTIENPNADSDRELIVFRDSFGSSIAPLLMQGYKSVTLVDIRYISSSLLPNYLDFHGQDVLFLYSTLILNDSSSLK